MTLRGPQKALFNPSAARAAGRSAPALYVFEDGSFGYLIRYRIVSEDNNRYSSWSNIYKVEAPQPPNVFGEILVSGNIVQVVWDDIQSRPQYDIFVQSTLEINEKSLTSNVATIKTTQNHQLAVGDQVTVFGVDPTLNGNYTITAVPAPNLFSYLKTASNVSATPSSGSVVSPFKYHGTSPIHTYSLLNDVGATRIDIAIQVESVQKEYFEPLIICEIIYEEES